MESDTPGSEPPACDRVLRYADAVDLVLSTMAPEPDRARALRAAQLRSERLVQVVAVTVVDGNDGEAGPAAATLLTGLDESAPCAVTLVGTVAAALLQPGSPQETATRVRHVLDGVIPRRRLRVGIGGAVPALDAHISWRQARNAMRFSGEPDLEPVADHGELGVLTLFAELDPDVLAGYPDVVALAAHALTTTGPQDIAVLDAFCRTGSLRRAAAELHMHHSTVSPRIERIEQVMGWDLSHTRQRLKARMTLLVSRLARPVR